MTIRKLLSFTLSAPKTAYVNLRALPLREAVKLPILVSYRCIIDEIHKGSIRFPNAGAKFGLLQIGVEGTAGIQPISDRSFLSVSKSGTWNVKGRVVFHGGTTVRIGAGAVLTMGDACSFNTNTFISCSHRIDIGDGCMGEW